MFRLICLSLSLAVTASVTFAQDGETIKSEEQLFVAKHGTPRIDGNIDEVWKQAQRVDVNKVIDRLLTIDKDVVATAKVRVLWDTDHVYALWQVKDPQLSSKSRDPWDQDSVEFFIDENRKRSKFYQYDDAQYRVSFEGKISGQGVGFDESNVKAVARKTRSGYVVEMSMKIQGNKLKSGRKLGVELQVNDDSGTGRRGAVVKWNHAQDDSWNDTSNFGTVLLEI